MTSRLTILVKGLILIAVPLFFQLAFIAVVARMRRDNNIAELWTIHTKDVIAQAQRCRVGLLTAHGAIQGYILTRDPSFEQNLDRLSREIPPQLEVLISLVVDRQDQSHSALMIEQKAKAFLAFMLEGVQFVHDGRMDAPLAAKRRRQSQELLNDLDRDLEHFLDFERKLDQERHESLQKSWHTFDQLLKGGVVISLLFTVAMAFLFARNISSRISILTENARRLSEMKQLAPPIQGADEIARLDQVFHDMAQTLSESAQRERHHAEMVERKAEELAKVNAQLREKAAENEMFVYSVSHDLRSPLVNLQGFSKELQLIGQDLGRIIDRETIPEDVRKRIHSMIQVDMGESIKFIQTAVTRLSSIIDALLRLSRAGRVEYRYQLVEVRPIIDRVVAALRGTIDERNASVIIGELSQVWGDPTAVEQVFANLIGNAVNYLDRSRPGVIEIFVVDHDPSMTPSQVVFAVRDNGLGISEQYRSKIFNAFQRLHGDVAKGEGVGLALVQRMVERHGGRVWFESQAGVGTTFFVAFPGDGTDTEVPESMLEAISPDRENRSIQNGRS